MLGRNAGLSIAETRLARAGGGSDARSAAIASFTKALVEEHGHVSAAELDQLKATGLSESELPEVVANVALTTLTNYTNNVARTAIDFPLSLPNSRPEPTIHSRRSIMSINIKPVVLSRRSVLTRTTASVLSAGAVALLGDARVAHGQISSADSDISILNVAVGLEYEGIGAYAIALKSGLLEPDIAAVATKFQDDHKRHNDALIATVRALGGESVSPRTETEYAEALDVDRLRSQADILDLAARLELSATNAYLGVIPSFSDSPLARVAARLAADEASHFALLNFTLGRPLLPALGFGA